MPQPQIALVTARAARGLDEDLAPLEAALRAAGARPTIADWDDDAIDWTCFDLALLRSTWDYTSRLPEFLAWLSRAATQTRLVNPLPVVRWNLDKHYLRDLAGAGVPVVASAFVEPGAAVATVLADFLDAQPTAEFVVKPAIGAGSRDARRYTPDQRRDAAAHVARLSAAGRSVLLQPYLARVDEDGETALIHFAGTFSHAIRKGPLLRLGQEPTRALFAAEHITSRTPAADELAVARQTLQAIPFSAPLTYARIDLLRDEQGVPRVLELELVEPSLFFAHAPGSAARFAATILAALCSDCRREAFDPA
jgi:O-ureido-D-serine cyclo-ligase